MKKFRAFIAALALLAASLFVATSNVSPASAVLANCVKAGYYSPQTAQPASPPFHTYAGLNCLANGVGGGTVRLRITCRYWLLISHTYNVTSAPVTAGNWTWASCGDHQDSFNQPDVIIHACPIMSNGSSYFGSDLCF